MVSPAGFEPATTGIKRTALGRLWQCSDTPKSLALNVFKFSRVYLVAPKIPVPSLRGDAVVTDTTLEPQGSLVYLRHLMATQSLGLFFTSIKLPPLTLAH